MKPETKPQTAIDYLRQKKKEDKKIPTKKVEKRK